jgi:hypothetical protein
MLKIKIEIYHPQQPSFLSLECLLLFELRFLPLNKSESQLKSENYIKSNHILVIILLTWGMEISLLEIGAIKAKI